MGIWGDFRMKREYVKNRDIGKGWKDLFWTNFQTIHIVV